MSGTGGIKMTTQEKVDLMLDIKDSAEKLVKMSMEEQKIEEAEGFFEIYCRTHNILSNYRRTLQ